MTSRNQRTRPEDNGAIKSEQRDTARSDVNGELLNKLRSVSDKELHVNYDRAFFGSCRSVDEFEKLNRVGEGTYGVVYRARDTKTSEIVALKKIRMERENDGLPISSLREIMLLKRLRHENIVNVKHVAVGNKLDQVFLVMEYCEQDMATLMDTMHVKYTVSEIKCLMLQLLKGLEYCHDNFVIHRDLKLSNLLLTSHGILKIADFGLGRTFGVPTKPSTPKVVTLWYRAPELLFGETNYSNAVDLWSVGCILGELVRGRPLLPGNVEQKQIELIVKLLGTPHEGIWQGFNRLPLARSIKLPEQRYSTMKIEFSTLSEVGQLLLSGLLTFDPKKRLTVKQALAHTYFTENPPPQNPRFLPTFPEIRNLQSEQAKKRAQQEDDRKKRLYHDREIDSTSQHFKRRAL